ncbi:hypothetical protein V6N13_049349 [Hibiscus sabdariffa]|uniref:Uncharacterized protein n=1 Tax=Hibiscus sabdariffa TaxID=183260 RepID=A0ABR2QXK9_9ROSI
MYASMRLPQVEFEMGQIQAEIRQLHKFMNTFLLSYPPLNQNVTHIAAVQQSIRNLEARLQTLQLEKEELLFQVARDHQRN